MMFHPSGTICAQNVRFYIETTLSVHGEVILPVSCFPAFPQLFAFPYTFDLFFFACLSVFTQVGRSVPKIFRDDFSTRMGPSLPEILRGNFFYPSRSI